MVWLSVRGRSPFVVDVALAVATWASVVIGATVEGRAAWWVPVLALLTAVPLLWRRRYPFAVAGIVGAATVWMALTQALGDPPAGQLVATYTFAALCPPLKRALAVAGSVVGIAVSILVPDEEVLNLGLTGIVFGVAYALGMSARARRDRIAMLEERARRLAGQREAAAARERARIAREMHDVLAHAMSMVAIQAEAGPVVVRTDPDKAEEVFGNIAVTARDALAQLRRTLGVLREDGDAPSGPLPGMDALPELVEGFRQAGLAVALRVDGSARTLPADLGATAYRIVQESLTNTVKHAGAETASVRLTWGDAALCLEVRDDGRARNAERNGHGHGLLGMRERVEAVGGELVTGRDGAGGFRVAATLPLL